MNEVLKRLLQAIRFERDAFVWMDLNDRATGDALILVAVTRLLLLLGFGFSVLGLTTSISGIEVLVASMINAAVFWLAYSGLVYAASRFLLDGGGSYATMLRITGFAYPTLLLLIVTGRAISNAILALVVGSLWFLAVVAQGVRYEADLPLERAAIAAGAGLVGWIIVSSIFGRGVI
jgi:hypothetical protein